MRTGHVKLELRFSKNEPGRLSIQGGFPTRWTGAIYEAITKPLENLPDLQCTKREVVICEGAWVLSVLQAMEPLVAKAGGVLNVELYCQRAGLRNIMHAADLLEAHKKKGNRFFEELIDTHRKSRREIRMAAAK